MRVTEYVYAGFTFRITEDGDKVSASPLPGQHPAAYKDRHRRAAEEQYRIDNAGR